MRASFLEALLAAALALALSCSRSSSGPRGPDVLFVSLDTLRADRLSCYGCAHPTTPFLDALAARGTRFAEAIAPSCHTAPSHMSLFTGLDPAAHGVRNVPSAQSHVRRLSDDVESLPEAFQAAGWRTAAFTDRGNVMPAMGFDRGFEHRHFEHESLPAKRAALAAWLEQMSRDEALFVFFHSYQTHAPYLPPPPWRGRFTADDYAGPFRERYDALAGSAAAEAHDHARSFLATWEGMGARDVAFLSALYDENVAYADDELSQLWDDWVRARGAEPTLVAFVSDHGEAFLEHGELGHPAALYRELVAVPFILAGPGVPVAVVDEPVSTASLAATLAELAGLAPLKEAQAPSLVALMRGAASSRGPVFSQWLGGKPGIFVESAIEDGTHAIRSAESGVPGPTLALFDWAADAREERDLAADRGSDGERFTGLLGERRLANVRIAERCPSIDAGSVAQELREELRALGYLGEGGGDGGDGEE